MSLIDWLIVLIPVAGMVGVGFYSRKYVRSVADFLSAGRVAGRYVMSMGEVANALSIMALAAYVEVHYKTGFALLFWNNMLLPLTVVIGLLGYCTYRFRETRAMSLGQFLEMRYNRPFRIFAATLRSISEMLANMIMPAIAARFIIYFLDIPHSFTLCGIEFSSFVVIMIICLSIAVTIICCGGTLALMITDSLQGLILFPLMVVFVVFIMYKFDWSTEMVPVMMDRAPDESFLNPFDIEKLRDFNLFMIFVMIVRTIMHKASWIGAGYTTAAKTPHEQKMAGILGSWRNMLAALFYALIGIGIIALMNYHTFSGDARRIRVELSGHIAQALVSPENRADFMARIKAVPEQKHTIGKDAPLSQDKNLDTPTFEAAHAAFKAYDGEAEGNLKFQQYRTLYQQQLMAVSMRDMLPPVITGLFFLLMMLAMISTDDSRIFSSALTISQDVILPFCKNGLSQKQHLWLLRFASMGVGVFYLCGSTFMSQLDYIELFVTLMTMMWLGGCGPVMIFGLYSRFGNSAGAFASVISGMLLAGGSTLVQRNWAAKVYPWLLEKGWTDNIGSALETLSSPFNPYIMWKMDPVKFPINSYEIFFITMVITLIIFCAVSALTQKEPFNLDRMLHRGIYNVEGEEKRTEKWTWSSVFRKLIGITPEYTRGDKCIAWSVFIYSFIYKFFLSFIVVAIWNTFSPWPIEWWGHYFYITVLAFPAVAAFVTIFWFGIGGVKDMISLFRDLEKQTVDVLDNGQVEGNVSLADKARFEKLEKESK